MTAVDYNVLCIISYEVTAYAIIIELRGTFKFAASKLNFVRRIENNWKDSLRKPTLNIE